MQCQPSQTSAFVEMFFVNLKGLLVLLLEESAWSLKAGNETTKAILELTLPPTPSPKSTACGLCCEIHFVTLCLSCISLSSPQLNGTNSPQMATQSRLGSGPSRTPDLNLASPGQLSNKERRVKGLGPFSAYLPLPPGPREPEHGGWAEGPPATARVRHLNGDPPSRQSTLVLPCVVSVTAQAFSQPAQAAQSTLGHAPSACSCPSR